MEEEDEKMKRGRAIVMLQRLRDTGYVNMGRGRGGNIMKLPQPTPKTPPKTKNIQHNYHPRDNTSTMLA